jgi:hypothetical protein
MDVGMDSPSLASRFNLVVSWLLFSSFYLPQCQPTLPMSLTITSATFLPQAEQKIPCRAMHVTAARYQQTPIRWMKKGSQPYMSYTMRHLVFSYL